MKRIFVFILCYMMILGSFYAQAEDSAEPLLICPHTAGEKKYTYVRDLDCCTTVSYSDVYCSFCGEFLRSTPLEYTYSHIWSDEEIVDGEQVTMCLKCDMIQ